MSTNSLASFYPLSLSHRTHTKPLQTSWMIQETKSQWLTTHTHTNYWCLDSFVSHVNGWGLDITLKGFPDTTA